MIGRDFRLGWPHRGDTRGAATQPAETVWNQVEQMSRNFILFLGVICWTGAAADALWHLAQGDLLVPAVMAVAFVIWVTVRRRHYARLALAEAAVSRSA